MMRGTPNTGYTRRLIHAGVLVLTLSTVAVLAIVAGSNMRCTVLPAAVIVILTGGNIRHMRVRSALSI